MNAKQTSLVALACLSLLVPATTMCRAADTPTQSPAQTLTNFALNKKFVSSDPNLSNWNGLTDGTFGSNAATCYASGKIDTFPKTVTVDLEKAQALGSVIVGVPPFGATKTVELSLSADGTTYTKVGSNVFVQNTEAKFTYKFATTTAQFVRLTYVDHYETSQYGPFHMFASELEAYAPAK